MPPEKRKFSRIPLQFPVTLTLDNGSVFEIEEFINISVGGCLIPSTKEIVQTAACSITIVLGDDPLTAPKIEARGEIVRHTETDLAVKFTKIDPESLFHLQNIIRYNAEDPDAIDEEIREHPGLL